MGDVAGIRDWVDTLGQAVASVRFEQARELFAEEVIGFGTFKDMVHGIDQLDAGQWRSIWPTIKNFAFDLDSLEVLFSPDGRQAVAMVVWNSIGFNADGSSYPRPGRATVVLRRDEGVWRGWHTHFSLFPAEQKLSFGTDGAEQG
ncbi:MAG: SnoaL-like domain-containing protein [Chromatiales bacterium]|jgi:ketosteroid isomerase-like protein|nr:SnoaL-like domain-containing protein [Chromatiales bacterium]